MLSRKEEKERKITDREWDNEKERLDREKYLRATSYSEMPNWQDARSPLDSAA